MTESDILHQNGNAWVLRDRARECYNVLVSGAVCSVSDSQYALTENGKSVAVARCDYLGKRNARMNYAGNIVFDGMGNENAKEMK